jgi:hypothetical protein
VNSIDLAIEPEIPVWVKIDKNQIDKFDGIINALIVADNDVRRFELLKEAKSRLTIIKGLIERDAQGSD